MAPSIAVNSPSHTLVREIAEGNTIKDLADLAMSMLAEHGCDELESELVPILIRNCRVGRVDKYLCLSPENNLRSYVRRLIDTFGVEGERVTALRNGDVEAQVVLWQELVNRAFRRLVCRGTPVDRAYEEANDAAQDTWHDIITGKAVFPFDVSFDAWAITILYRRLARAYTQRGDILDREQTEYLDARPTSWHDRLPDPDSQLDYYQLGVRQLVEQALTQLSVEQREAVGLFYLQGMSAQRAARIVNCSPGAFNSRCHRARRKLWRYLDSQGLALSDCLFWERD